eukprot:CAMPEP_0195519498 /NCGR_PEP_ID=MMETSP0794_2-20130614/14900_1 /TAXON_ID=515487 /ORGANISM="Stephanopyxis turris, Strain CCMP 815" /LENGTH=363 /DNA_ID=CAMNT_0040648659 /DNA_START=42 /DNA_END=1133 /DNA_ORIENTATION=+
MTATAGLSTSPSIVLHPSAIGTAGKPWGVDEFNLWRETREKQRCYFTDIVPQIEALREESLFEVIQYGTLPFISKNCEDVADTDTSGSPSFPLFAVRTRDWSDSKPNVFITGGVHGYETSGVEGALLFLRSRAEHYSDHFNILVIPCVSPWGYERIQRWNAKGVDPNRSFNPEGEIVKGRSFNPEAATEESAALISFLKSGIGTRKKNEEGELDWICHLDLHETTDTDETEFRPAKNARDGMAIDSDKGEIPDGFYLVQDETSPMPEWFTAMIESVRKVTHIAPSDADGKLIGEVVSQEGVIEIPNKKSLGLCAGVTNAPYRTTTEVYPDSKKATCTPEQCNQAQVACIEGALDYIIANGMKE